MLFVAIAAAAGAFEVWWIVGWREIDPLNLAWQGGDPVQYQIGWEFLRHYGIWHLPPTWVAALDYPTGASAAYLDVIPLVAVPLSIASPLLPVHMQYLGCYAVVSFILQAYFGFRLGWRISRGDSAIALLGGAIFLLSPVLAKELYGHFALLSQWIVLAAIDFYLRISPDRSLRRNVMAFVVLIALACAIQPYIALMALIIGVAGVARAFTVSKRPVSRLDVLWVLLLPASAALSLLAAGFIVPGHTEFVGSDYTRYSMNLLAPINPETPLALILRSFPVVHGWNLAGYNYLGIGILFVLFFTLARRPALLRNLWSPSLLPLLVAAMLCTLLALSVEVCFADRVLFTVPVPEIVFNLLAMFRGSGRLFWPVYYLLFVAAIAGVCATVQGPWARRVLLAFALLLQCCDLLPIRNGVAYSAEESHPRRLVSGVWAALPRHFAHLEILPAFQCGGDTPAPLAVWPEFAHLAADGGMTLNSVYLSRVSAHIELKDCVQAPAEMLRDGFRPDTVYILSDRLTAAMEHRPQFSGDCRRVDGFNLCLHQAAKT